jgi:hypothetical protein
MPAAGAHRDDLSSGPGYGLLWSDHEIQLPTFRTSGVRKRFMRKLQTCARG